MSVYSMTGYANVQQIGGTSGFDAPESGLGAHRLGLEIRSVNSRFLDLALRLPDELREHEPALRELLAARLKRGKVELRAALDEANDGTLATPSPRRLQQLNSMQDAVRVWLPAAQPLTVAEALRLCAGEHGAAPISWQALQPLAQQLVQALLESREREGARLAAMLLERVAQLRALCEQARPLAPRLAEQQRERFVERWNEALALAGGSAATVSSEAAQERALAEATAFSLRIDVAEELTRLASHLDEIERLLAGAAGSGGALGKRLEFLIQELQREANTLGSKAAAIELTRIALDMKVLIEQMREQVQNVE